MSECSPIESIGNNSDTFTKKYSQQNVELNKSIDSTNESKKPQKTRLAQEPDDEKKIKHGRPSKQPKTSGQQQRKRKLIECDGASLQTLRDAGGLRRSLGAAQVS